MAALRVSPPTPVVGVVRNGDYTALNQFLPGKILYGSAVVKMD